MMFNVNCVPDIADEVVYISGNGGISVQAPNRGARFTGKAFTSFLERHRIRIGMEGSRAFNQFSML
jgi:hypothetical protein